MDHKMDWRLGVEASRFEALEDFCVATLGQTIAPGVGDRGEADLDADRCAILPEQPAGELAAIIGDYAVG
jgi:hypothetical protein